MGRLWNFVSKYGKVNPECKRCEKPLAGQEAIMVRPVVFDEQTNVEKDGRKKYYKNANTYTYNMINKVDFYCETCFSIILDCYYGLADRWVALIKNNHIGKVEDLM